MLLSATTEYAGNIWVKTHVFGKIGVYANPRMVCKSSGLQAIYQCNHLQCGGEGWSKRDLKGVFDGM